MSSIEILVSAIRITPIFLYRYRYRFSVSPQYRVSVSIKRVFVHRRYLDTVFKHEQSYQVLTND